MPRSRTVLCTDLGSSKGTRLDAKDGKKIMAKILLPGQSIYIGGIVLTYTLGAAPLKKSKSAIGSLLSRKK